MKFWPKTKTRKLLEAMYDWGQWACLQGTSTEIGTPGWDHEFISTWEQATDLIPEVGAFIGRPLGIEAVLDRTIGGCDEQE